MSRGNPSAAEHADNVTAFLSNADDELDAAKDAFEAGDMTDGWQHYLEAFQEIGRAQQEVLHASQTDDEGILDVLDQANTRLNELDAVVRRGLAYRIGIDVPLELIFETAPPTAIMARADVIGVPLGDWKEMRRHIAEAAVARHGSIRKAAPFLGISRNQLRNWLQPASSPAAAAAAAAGEGRW